MLYSAIALTILLSPAVSSTEYIRRERKLQPSGIQCSATEQYYGNPSNRPGPAPLRGPIGCVDLDAISLRDPDMDPILDNQDALNIFGPMENGFSADQPGARCLGNTVVPGGIDTNLAEHMMDYVCTDETFTILDTCGGHAVPYHYHERMSCLYNSDHLSGHSTRIGTAGDGNGIYGMYIDGGVEPSDLDYCGGRFGVTPDSIGLEVYYYPITAAAPFSVGCYGPVETQDECFALYPSTCLDSGGVEEVTTEYGSGLYQLDCPCYDANGSNVVGQGRPGYLEPEPTTSVPTTSPTPEPITSAPSLDEDDDDFIDDDEVFDCADTDWVFTGRRGVEEGCEWIAKRPVRCSFIRGTLPGSSAPVLAQDGCPGTCKDEC